ncbi:GNAT family N-acetyltransferase [Gemelliphila palaticanis]|uniref:GNAT family N-acetyltransferase n=1 Tax=Gemelliphila palaticanis TaxID=81950 RepID=A0ABX2SX32_9BACL|nr:GNAT family N-acetyltransferase [Gemella palaticanis]MBF0714735.1 GNAT family N-acetyltransferase [Gemella palaticanis]NYS46665.1 GNAT family N-acetyltransferase [Gemella palaticanis]
MEVRKAKKEDLKEIMAIYEVAKTYMRNNGNSNQWINNYPSKELLLEDILKGNLYVIVEEKNIYGVFMFSVGIDETYINIYEGEWLNDETYGTIHRIASSGVKSGIFSTALNYCKTVIDNVRIDTHEDNKIMQDLLLNNNFQYCGIIYLLNGDKRLAYNFYE